jgi:hypothetical protein
VARFAYVAMMVSHRAATARKVRWHKLLLVETEQILWLLFFVASSMFIHVRTNINEGISKLGCNDNGFEYAQS